MGRGLRPHLAFLRGVRLKTLPRPQPFNRTGGHRRHTMNGLQKTWWNTYITWAIRSEEMMLVKEHKTYFSMANVTDTVKRHGYWDIHGYDSFFIDSIQLRLRMFWFLFNSWLTMASKNWFKPTQDSKWFSGILFKSTHDSNRFSEFWFKSTHDSKSFPEFRFKSTHDSKGFLEFWFKSTPDS